MPTPREVGGHRTWAHARPGTSTQHRDRALTAELDLTQPANLRTLSDNGAARLVGCPECQAHPFDWCTTSTGTRRSCHRARRHQGRREAERRAQAIEAQQ